MRDVVPCLFSRGVHHPPPGGNQRRRGDKGIAYYDIDSLQLSVMRRSVSLAHRDGDGSDAKECSDRSNSFHHLNPHHEHSSWGELRQRIESLEQWRQHQEGVSNANGDKTEEIGLLQSKENGNVHSELATDSTPTIARDQQQSFTDNNIMDQFELPESTYSLLMSAPICSMPFNAGILTSALSLMCLVIVLLDELQSSEPGNPLGVPAGLPPEVRMAQYLGIIIGKEETIKAIINHVAVCSSIVPPLMRILFVLLCYRGMVDSFQVC